jgi:hypothetical protein
MIAENLHTGKDGTPYLLVCLVLQLNDNEDICPWISSGIFDGAYVLDRRG